MVLSNDGTFELVFFDPFRQVNGKPLIYKHIMTPEGICVIGETGQQFQLEITCKDKAVYGVRVIVDGYTIPGKKTFRQKGKISGFPQNDGNFRCFKFQRPQIDPESINKFNKNVYRPPWDEQANDVRDYKGGPGEIIIKIYETQQKPARNGGGGGGNAPQKQVEPFIQLAKNENKDEMDQTLSIAEGEVIPMPPRNPDRPPREKEFMDIVLYESIVQSYRVIYKDASSLVAKGYVKLNSHNDFAYLTEEYFMSNETAVIQVLQTIIESGQKDQQLEEVAQTLDVMIERLQYYCQSFELLNLFLSKEQQQDINEFTRQQTLETELVKFMDRFPEFFKTINERTYGIKARFEQKVYQSKHPDVKPHSIKQEKQGFKESDDQQGTQDDRMLHEEGDKPVIKAHHEEVKEQQVVEILLD